MRIAAIAARTHRWPIAGLGAARGRSERASIVIELRGDRGAIGLGEAAPLPGMSRDSLDDAEQALAALARCAPFDVDLDRFPLLDIADRAAMQAVLAAPPAARFAIETALLDALGRERAASIAALLDPRGPDGDDRSKRTVPLAAVVDEPGDARRAFGDGIRCLKIKLSAGDDPGRAFAIAAAVPGARLRIDANRTWPRAEVADRLAALSALPIDFVEEPCDAAHQLLSEALPCPIALDESLLAMTAAEIDAALASRRLAAVVLKPTLLGGFSAVLSLAERARRRGVAPIVSHALEGPIGTAACAELALALGGDHAVGLAAHAALAGWPFAVPQLAADHVRAATRPGLGLGFGLGFGAEIAP